MKIKILIVVGIVTLFSCYANANAKDAYAESIQMSQVSPRFFTFPFSVATDLNSSEHSSSRIYQFRGASMAMYFKYKVKEEGLYSIKIQDVNNTESLLSFTVLEGNGIDQIYDSNITVDSQTEISTIAQLKPNFTYGIILSRNDEDRGKKTACTISIEPFKP